MVDDNDIEKIVAWSGLPVEPVESLVHDLVEEQVKRTPDDQAVESWDGNYTYHEISHLSSKVARYLESLGIKPNVFVVLAFDKTKCHVIANLAVLKAGGACASVDPSQPEARLKAIIEDTQATVLLTEPKHAEKFRTKLQHVVEFSCSLLDHLSLDETTENYTCSTVTPSDPAFIVFTSGSTGRPKGILQSHVAYCTSVVAYGRTFKSTPYRRHLQFAAHTFDNSISDIFVTLGHGGTVCIPSEEDRLNSLASVIDRMKVDHAQLTPTVARLLRPEDVPRLKVLVLTGEPLTKESVTAWADSVHLLNLYGPAEATILTTLNDSMCLDTHPLDVGYAVGGRCFITDPDDYHMLTPVGGIGELLLEGPFLAEGYLNDGHRTNAAFIENPEWTHTEKFSHGHFLERKRFYRTGDLVRYNDDGSLRLVGRNDTQIKLRGQRIELGGIEYQICCNSGVRHATVLFPQAGACSGNLVVVLSFHTQSSASHARIPKLVSTPYSRDIQSFLADIQVRLAATVPTYMIPSTWAVVENLPLLPSGKLDRKMLKSWLEVMSKDDVINLIPLPLGDNPDHSVQHFPRTENEQIILSLCCRLLNIPIHSVDMNISFLRLGGDSISAMSLKARCHTEGKLSLSVHDILRCKSIRELAQHCKPLSSATYSVALQENPEVLFELSPIQQMFFASSPEGSPRYTQSYLLELRHSIPIGVLEAAFEALVRCHSMLRAKFKRAETAARWQQLIPNFDYGEFNFEQCQFDNLTEITDIMRSAWAKLDLTEGPVFSVSICERSDSKSQVLFLTAHHLVIDLVSWRIIIQDLEDLLGTSAPTWVSDQSTKRGSSIDKSDLARKGLKRETAASFPKRTITKHLQDTLSFQAWTKLQLRHLQSGPASAKTETPIVAPIDWNYWGMSEEPNLFEHVEVIEIALDEKTTTLLLGDANRPLRTEPVDIFLGVIMHAFQRSFPERPAVTFFNESHGRETREDSLDLSRTVGWFATMLPITMSTCSEDPIDTIRQVKDLRYRFSDRGWRWFSSQLLQSGGNIDIEVMFNYFGIYQSSESDSALLRPLQFGGKQPTEEGGPKVRRPSLFEVAVRIDDRVLQATFTYNRRMHKTQLMETWAHSSERIFKEVADKMADMEPQLTLSDVPLLSSNYGALDRLCRITLPALGIPLSNVEDIFPCSPIQRGILVSQIQQPQCYTIRWSFQVQASMPTSVLSIERLQAAWQQVVNHHAIMRTVLLYNIAGDDSFSQITLKDTPAKMNVSKAKNDQDGSRANKGKPIEHFESEDLPHELYINPSPSSQGLACYLMISHAITDGISLSILMRDLALAYEGSLHMQPATPYRDYVSYIQGQSVEISLAYWKNYLQSIKHCNLPSFTHADSETSGLCSVDVPLVHPHQVVDFCQKESLTLTTVIHTAWLLVLQTYTGLESPCFGYLSSGRNLPIEGVEDAIGPYINMLICRAWIDPEQKAIELLNCVQSDTYKSLEHQVCSLGLIQNALGLSAQSLFNTAVSQEKSVDMSTPSERGISIKVEDVRDPTEYDLAVRIEETTQGLAISLKYWTPKISNSQALNVAHTFATTISSIVASPYEPIKRLERCSARDIAQIRKWNESPFDTVNNCIHDLIHQRALLQPNVEAVCSWDGCMTYADLDAASNRFAHLILQRVSRVGPETIVPLCFSKSIWQPVALLAVLKTGAAFVNLDPSHPIIRLKSILADVEACAIVCSPEHLDLCKRLADTVIVLDRAAFNAQRTISEAPSIEVSPSNAAYVIFTSGTTGKPKGCVTEHRALASNIRIQQQRFQIKHGLRALQFASYVFDVCLLETLTMLVIGNCVCIPKDDERLDDIGGAMRRMEVTWANLTPSVASVLSPSDVPQLKVLVVGGEPLTSAVLLRWASVVHLCNAYGPSEACISSVINSNVHQSNNPSDIGKGAGALTWIVNAANHDRLAPIGSVGEVLLEGPILARGYLNEKEKTEASFIINPDWARETTEQAVCRQRLFYKTGDLVRYTPDGNLIYIARLDAQVKLHGQRLELDEIEHHLVNAPQVNHAIASLPKIGAFEGILVATVALHKLVNSQVPRRNPLEIVTDPSVIDKATKAISDIQEYLNDRLPTYMIPKTIIPVNAIPLSTTGKLDRREVDTFLAGLDPQTSISGSRNTSVRIQPPSTAIEKQLQSMWAQTLNVSLDQVGRNSSFLRLGGDSISALQLASRCRPEGLKVSVQDILRTKTMGELATKVTRTENRQVTKMKEDPANAEFELSPIQKMHFELTADREGLATQSFLLRCTRKIPLSALAHSLSTLVKTHAMLRARFKRAQNGEWRQRITSKDGDSKKCYKVGHHTLSSLIEAADIARGSRACIDIVSGPVFAVDSIEVGMDHFLCLTAHHLVVDLVSWRILLQDLEGFLTLDDFSPLLSMSFQRWCNLQAQYAKEFLPPTLALPSDLRPETLRRPEWGLSDQLSKPNDSIIKGFSMDATQTNLLLGDCNRVYRTNPVELFHASILCSFVSVFDREPVIFHEGHGREAFDDTIDLSRTIGWFTTIYPVAVRLGNAHDIFDVVRRTKDTCRRIPSNGWAYFTSRFLNMRGREEFGALKPEIMLNYHGRFQQLEKEDALFEQLPLSKLGISDDDPNAERLSLIDIEISILEGRLRFDFVFNRLLEHQELLRQWIKGCEECLSEIVVRQAQEQRWTPTDFLLFQGNYEALQSTLDSISPHMDSDMQVPVEDIYPCSAMQLKILGSQAVDVGYYQGMWLWKVSLSSSPNVDGSRLEAAWKEVTRRHAILRTIFVRENERHAQWNQVVLEDPAIDIVHRSTSSDTAAATVTALQTIPPYTFPRARPLHRLTISPTSTGTAICRLDINHAINDGTAMEIILRDWATIYADPTLLPSTPSPQYRSYIAHLTTSPRHLSHAYWSTYLCSLQPCLFPLTRHLASPLHHRYHPIRVPNSLASFCSSHQITLASLIRAIWALTLYNYTRQLDICFGYLVYGRDIPALPYAFEIVGPLFNTLVCRVRLEHDAAVARLELVRRMQRDYVEGLGHQDFSYWDLGMRQAMFNTLINHRGSITARGQGGCDGGGGGKLVFEEVECRDPMDYAIVLEVAQEEQSVRMGLSFWEPEIEMVEARGIAAVVEGFFESFVNEEGLREIME